MSKPIVGIIGNSYKIDNKYPAQGSGTINIEAIAEVSEALPVIIPSLPNYFTINELLNSAGQRYSVIPFVYLDS